ncbi:MAG: tRNA (guanosine(18)-2'-O)-methyltransferase TrmH [Acidobacteriota bacterium]|nr:tRNA (guanosine(18)-2'-O)-methyltransferase TrmH [Acidobacteriota bacterium]
MTPERFQRIRHVLDRRQPDLTVLLENVHKPHNFAAILRTADAVGLLEAHAVFAHGRLRTSLVSSSGSDRWLEVHVHRSARLGLDHLRQHGLRILAAHPGDTTTDYREVDFTQPTAILLGQEKDGITPQTLVAADELVSIPMSGFVTSLNVSVAAAVLLFEAQRQRIAAGLYASRRLDQELYDRKLFEWSYPELADICRRRDTPYPALSDTGELLGDVPR